MIQESRIRKRLLIFTVPVFWGLTVLFELLGMGPSKGGVPTTLFGWIIVLVDAALETAIFTGIFYWISTYFLRRFFKKQT
jgi:hypothetical protein